MQNKPVPFVKWAGGKRQLVPEIRKRMPQSFNRYFEPFVGGGALFFELQPNNAVINDINRALIHAYLQIKHASKDAADALIEIDRQYESAQDKKAFYYLAREEYNHILLSEPTGSRAVALLIFINKHCFNGLYRVNSKGAFNVPFNKSTAASGTTENIFAVSHALKNTKITSCDFEQATQDAKKGDFIFFDSPYAPLNPTSFESYTKQGFSKTEHKRLSELFKRKSKEGCFCMLTNHNTPFIRNLYNGFTMEEVSVRRSINSNAANRRGKELIIRNYA